MPLADHDDTIAAIASARGAAERGVVRLAGPRAIEVAERLIDRSIQASAPRVLGEVGVHVELAGAPRALPCDLFVWPDSRSYTKQPAIELHTIGSPPLLEALLEACLAAGARLAEPGEFTLRAFLAGRLDLVQAEAVLAVIDAQHSATLTAALAQLAGGLSGPLHRLRAELLALLADLEAGLDFVDEEDVRFVEQEELANRLRDARRIVRQAIEQTESRSDGSRRPRVVIAGEPNIGKSSLYNALVERFGESASGSALVADHPGVTRDAVLSPVVLGGVACELVDTAGIDERGGASPIDTIAQERALDSQATSDLVLQCCRWDDQRAPVETQADRLIVATQCDQSRGLRPEAGVLPTSAMTGDGLDELALAVGECLKRAAGGGASEAIANTAERCSESLRQALERLDRATLLASEGHGEELVSIELRGALDDIGRVVGEVVTDDVLDQIFGKFCIGK